MYVSFPFQCMAGYVYWSLMKVGTSHDHSMKPSLRCINELVLHEIRLGRWPWHVGINVIPVRGGVGGLVRKEEILGHWTLAGAFGFPLACYTVLSFCKTKGVTICPWSRHAPTFILGWGSLEGMLRSSALAGAQRKLCFSLGALAKDLDLLLAEAPSTLITSFIIWICT